MTANKRPLEPRDLYRLRLINDAQIAPDGSRVAFVLKQMDEDSNEYRSNIYVVDRQGTVRQFTSGNKDSSPRWSPDGKHLAFLSGRKDTAQIYLLSTEGGESVALTERKLGAGTPVWSPDSTAIAFTGMVSTDPKEESESKEEKPKTAPTKVIDRAGFKADGAGYIGNRRSHIFVVDVADRKVEQVTEGDFYDNGLDWSPDSRHLLFASDRSERWDVSLGSDIYIVPREGGAARRLSESGSWFQPTFSPDGSRVAFAGQLKPDDAFAPARLYSMDRGGGDRRDEQGEWDGSLGDEIGSDVAPVSEDIFLRYRDDGVYFLGTERGVANVYRASGGQVEQVTQGRHSITDYSMAMDGTLAFSLSDPLHPSEIFVQAPGGEMQQLTHENDAFLGEVWIAAPERICFTGADGEESEGWLLAPRDAGSGKHPLLMYIHGGPHTAHGEVFFFEYQFLAGQGFGVFYPNIHGSSSYGRDYQISIWRDWGNKDFQDVVAATEAAMDRPWVDRQRVGIVGGSYGGYMTIWAMSHSDLFRAGITERCLANWLSFMGTSDSGWIWNRVTGAYPEEDVNKLWAMSPIAHVRNIKAPLMVMHSEGDDRTPVEQGEQVFNALRRLGTDTKFIRFPEETHDLSRRGKPSRRVERMNYIADWFKQKL